MTGITSAGEVLTGGDNQQQAMLYAVIEKEAKRQAAEELAEEALFSLALVPMLEKVEDVADAARVTNKVKAASNSADHVLDAMDAMHDLEKNADRVDDVADVVKSGSKTDVTTGFGYDAGNTPVRIDGDWTENDMKQALLGHPPRGLGSPDIHHGGQMPGGALHEVLPGQHRNNPALHPNTYNQGVVPEMRMEDRQLHWWYRAREQGADELLPDWIYD